MEGGREGRKEGAEDPRKFDYKATSLECWSVRLTENAAEAIHPETPSHTKPSKTALCELRIHEPPSQHLRTERPDIPFSHSRNGRILQGYSGHSAGFVSQERAG